MKEHTKMQRAKQNILMEMVGGEKNKEKEGTKKNELNCFYQ